MNNLRLDILKAIQSDDSFSVSDERIMRTYFAGLSLDAKKRFNEFFIAFTGYPFHYFLNEVIDE